MKKNLKLPTIIGIIVLILGLGAGLILLQFRNNILFNLKASPDRDPKEVKVTNISDKSFTISWITDKTTVGYVVFGETIGSLSQNAPDTDDSAKTSHSITLVGLKPTTDYYFKINSDGALKDNNGIAWKTKTGTTISTSTNTQIVSGSVVTQTGQPLPDALVYLNTGSSSIISTKTSANGNFVIPLSKLRNSDLSGYPVLTAKSLIEILVQSGTGAIATAQIYLEATNPVPAMSIGQNYDFRDEAPNNTISENPEANVNIPQATPANSGFNLGNTGSPAPAGSVTLESIDQGEKVTTTTPEFFGEGLKGTEITIEIHSTENITGKVVVDSKGNWTWEPPQGLSPGSHTITLKWKDAQGILRTLTRSFVVEASSGPAFVATPSGSPKATASATPRITRPATDSGTPVAGIATPTLVSFSIGFAFLACAIFIGKKSFD